MNAKNHEYIDHKDFNTYNNRKSNLRITDNCQNNQNRNGANRNNKTTGIRNVNYIKKSNEFWVQFRKEGIDYKWVFPINKFKEACKFADLKRKELFGEYAGNALRQ